MRFEFRQYHECQNGHPRFLYWKPVTGFENKAHWGDKHPECKCSTWSLGEGFGPKAPNEISTTLNDKNGKTVFEGDIVLDSYGRKLVVVWHIYRLRFEWIERPALAHFKYADMFDWVDLESGQLSAVIIGNIHEKHNSSNT